MNFEPKLVKEKIAIPAGSYWVPMKQRRARLILSMLEPQAPDSLAAWGLMDSVSSKARAADVADAAAWTWANISPSPSRAG